MLNPVSHATEAQATAHAAARPPAPQPQPHAAPTDTVQLSATAKAVQETLETSAQTAREAAGGDNQAQRLLAKEAAKSGKS
jgi:hypothetical protein